MSAVQSCSASETRGHPSFCMAEAPRALQAEKKALPASIPILAGREKSSAGKYPGTCGQRKKLCGQVSRYLRAEKKALRASIPILAGREKSSAASIPILAGEKKALPASIPVLAGKEKSSAGKYPDTCGQAWRLGRKIAPPGAHRFGAPCTPPQSALAKKHPGCGGSSGENPAHQLPLHIRQAVVAALVLVGQPLVVDAEQVQDRGLEVVDVDGFSATL